MTQIVSKPMTFTESNTSGRVEAQVAGITPSTARVITSPGVIDHSTHIKRPSNNLGISNCQKVLPNNEQVDVSDIQSETVFPLRFGFKLNISHNPWTGDEEAKCYQQQCFQQPELDILDSLHSWTVPLNEDLEFRQRYDCKLILFYNPWSGQGKDDLYLHRIEFDTSQTWLVSFGPIHPSLASKETNLEIVCTQEGNEATKPRDDSELPVNLRSPDVNSDKATKSLQFKRGQLKRGHQNDQKSIKALLLLSFISLYILIMCLVNSVIWKKLLYTLDESRWMNQHATLDGARILYPVPIRNHIIIT